MDKTERVGTCLLFTGATTHGYGKVSRGGRGGGTITAHRAVWEHHHGAAPTGMVIRHSCDVRACVDIAHLLLGTALENTRDMQRRSGPPRAKITPDQVRAIRADPRSQTAIAADYGLRPNNISLIKNRVTWAWLD
jgi:HNH endonuclease